MRLGGRRGFANGAAVPAAAVANQRQARWTAVTMIFPLALLSGCVPIAPHPPDGDGGANALAVPDDDPFAYRPDVRRLEIGDRVPEMQLTDVDGSPFSLVSMGDRVVVLTFFSAATESPNGAATAETAGAGNRAEAVAEPPTRPPGGVIGRVAEATAELAPRLADRVVVVPLLLDLSADAGLRLRAAARFLDDSAATGPVGRHWGPSAAQAPGPLWRFATADAATMAVLSATFGLVIWQEADGDVGHIVGTIVIDPAGRYADSFPGLAGWTALDLVAAVSLAAER